MLSRKDLFHYKLLCQGLGVSAAANSQSYSNSAPALGARPLLLLLLGSSLDACLCKVARLKAALPLLPMEVSHRHHLQRRAGVYAVDGHRHAVRVAAWPVVAADAASPARAGVRRVSSSGAKESEAPGYTAPHLRLVAHQLRVAQPPVSSLHATSAITD